MRTLLVLHLFAAATPRAGEDIRVESGDTLWSIARRSGCTTEDLRRANPGHADAVRIGETLRVPRCASAQPDTREPTARTDTAARSPRRGAAAPRTPARVDPPREPAPATHVVARGDTLGRIARAHGTDVATLERLNHLRSATIVVGQRLRVPARSSTPEPAPPRGEAPSPITPAGMIDPDVRAALPPPPTGSSSRAPRPRSPSAGVRVGEAPSGARARLVGAVQLPRDKAYYLRRPSRAYGHPHVVELTKEAIASVKRRHPDVHRLAVGDISSEHGGALPGHRSHRKGLDVDLGLYFERPPRAYPKRFVAADAAPLDLAATWSLLETFYKLSAHPGGPTIVFLDFAVQGRLYHWARKHGIGRQRLREILQYPHGRHKAAGFVRHEPAHDDHMHVRFGCPRERGTC